MILNVDDNEPLRYRRSKVLRRAGFDVIDGNSRQALELIRLRKPDVAILDVNLPELSGTDVCREVKSDPDLASVLVLELSASSYLDRSRVEGLNAGADNYLVEPVDNKVLVASVNALLRLRKAEQALRHSQESLELALEAGRLCTWDLDLVRDLATPSEGAHRVFGLRPEECPRTLEALLKRVHPQDRAGVSSELNETIEHGDQLELEFRIVRGDGEVRWVSDTGKVFRDKMGRAIRLAGVIKDVSRRKATMEALRRNEEFLRHLFESSEDCITVLDLEGRVLSMSQAGLRAMGLKDCAPFQGTSWAASWPEEHRQKARQAVEQAARGLQGRFQGLYPTKEGSRCWDTLLTPVRAESGRPERLLVVSRDISETRKAEDEVREREEQLQLAFDAALMGYWDWDVQSGKLRWSYHHEQMFGLRPGTFGGTCEAFLALVHPDDREAVQRAVQDAWERRTNVAKEFRIVHPNGELRWVSSKGQFYYDSRGRPWRMTGVVLDITEQKRAQAALEDADRRKNEFLAMLGHELRNPLATISLSIETLALSLPHQAAFKAAQQILKEKVEYIAHLLDDLLDVSRITSGRIELRRVPLDLGLNTRKAVEGLRRMSAERGQEVSLSPTLKPLMVSGDPARLEQVVSNLLTNAIKYTPVGGRIQVLLESAGREAVLRVIDNGMGIPSECLPHIFDLFVQAPQTLARSQGGLGIGLTIVRRIVELHGGTVTVQSEGSGRGSEFAVRLPLVSDMPEEEAGGCSGGESPRRPLRILVVEDQEDSALLMEILLKKSGHQVEVARDGIAALDAARAQEPEVIFLDIGLPGMDGYEVARRIRAGGGPTDHAFLIALTGYGQEEDRQRSREAGFDHHLTKPVTLEDLESILARMD